MTGVDKEMWRVIIDGLAIIYGRWAAAVAAMLWLVTLIIFF